MPPMDVWGKEQRETYDAGDEQRKHLEGILMRASRPITAIPDVLGHFIFKVFEISTGAVMSSRVSGQRGL